MIDSKIRILIVDDIAETRKNLRRLLQLETDMEIVGEAENGQDALTLAKQLTPDVVLMDINMPVMDGIQATERLSIDFPQIAIIILSVQGEQEYLRKAMSAGARDYLVKPPSDEDLIHTIRHVFDVEQKRIKTLSATGENLKYSGKIITVFSTKGGVGKSTVAVNLAASIQQKCRKKTVLVDLNLQFGDVSMMLDLIPRRTIADLIGESEQPDPATIENYLMIHESTGLKILPAPLRPEYAEAVKAPHVEHILKVLQNNYDYIIIDTRQGFDDLNLVTLDLAEYILMIATLDVLTIKNIKLGMEVMASLQYPQSKLKLVLNRTTPELGVSVKDFKENLKFGVSCHLPSDGKVVVRAGNHGIPFVLSDSKSEVAESIVTFAQELTGVKQLEQSLKALSNNRFKLHFFRR